MRKLGTSTKVTTCDRCGKQDLKQTVVYEDQSGVVHLGSDCANRVGWVSRRKAKRPAAPRLPAAEPEAQVVIEHSETRPAEEAKARVIEPKAIQEPAWVKRRAELMEALVDFLRDNPDEVAIRRGWRPFQSDEPTEVDMRKDWIGPFRIEHRERSAIIYLGDVELEELQGPTGKEVFDAVKAHRFALETTARVIWPTIKKWIWTEQKRSDFHPVPWAALRDRYLEPSRQDGISASQAELLFTIAMAAYGELDPKELDPKGALAVRVPIMPASRKEWMKMDYLPHFAPPEQDRMLAVYLH